MWAPEKSHDEKPGGNFVILKLQFFNHPKNLKKSGFEAQKFQQGSKIYHIWWKILVVNVEIICPKNPISPARSGFFYLDLCVIEVQTPLLEDPRITWRIIPVSKWLITMVSKSPKWGCSPYKWPKWLVNRGY